MAFRNNFVQHTLYEVIRGAEVTAISRSNSKEAKAKELGAKGILASTDANAMEKATSSFDLIIDTAPVEHDVV